MLSPCWVSYSFITEYLPCFHFQEIYLGSDQSLHNHYNNNKYITYVRSALSLLCYETEGAYEDVIKLYEECTILKEFPIFIKFQNQMAVDLGGICSERYSLHFRKGHIEYYLKVPLATLIPMIHPQTNSLSLVG